MPSARTVGNPTARSPRSSKGASSDGPAGEFFGFWVFYDVKTCQGSSNFSKLTKPWVFYDVVGYPEEFIWAVAKYSLFTHRFVWSNSPSGSSLLAIYLIQGSSLGRGLVLQNRGGLTAIGPSHEHWTSSHPVEPRSCLSTFQSPICSFGFLPYGVYPVSKRAACLAWNRFRICWLIGALISGF